MKLIIGIPFESAVSFLAVNFLERKSQEKIKLFKGEWLSDAGISIDNNMQLLKRMNASYSNLPLRNFQNTFSREKSKIQKSV